MAIATTQTDRIQDYIEQERAANLGEFGPEPEPQPEPQPQLVTMADRLAARLAGLMTGAECDRPYFERQ